MDNQTKSEREEVKAESPARRAYTSPRLQRLGSVRELTLGSGGKALDQGGQFNMG